MYISVGTLFALLNAHLKSDFVLYVLIHLGTKVVIALVTLPSQRKCNFSELKTATEHNKAERREHLSQHYAITLSQEMAHCQGISP